MLDTDLTILDYNYDNIKADIKNKLKLKSEWANVDLDNSIVDIFISLLTYYLMLDINAFNRMFLDSIPYLSGSSRVLNEFANLIGMEITDYTSATGQARFYLDSNNNVDTIVIPRGTEITGKNNKIYSTIETKSIQVGEKEVNINIIQGRFKVENYKSDGNENQIFKIYDKCDYKNISVYVNGEEWTRVDDLLFSNKNDKHYIVKFFEDYFVIMFGNGVNGYIPPIGSEIRIEYFMTDGKEGNIVTSNVIDTIISNIYYLNLLDYENNKVKVSNLKVTNDNYILGGRDKISEIEFRNNIKNYFSYNPYLWTKEDYKTYMLTNNNVLDVKIFNGWELYDDVNKHLVIYFYVVLKNKQKLNDYIKQELYNFLNNKRKMFNLRFEFIDVEYVSVICNIYLKLKNTRYILAELDSIKNNINSILNDYFDLEKVYERGKDLIRDIYNSDIVYTILNKEDRVNVVNVVLLSKELLFTTNNVNIYYSKSLVFKNIKFNYCYLYVENEKIGYFDNNFVFNFTNSSYIGKIHIVNTIKNTLTIVIQIIDNGLKNNKKFYFISETNDLNDLLIKNDNVVFVLDSINYEV